MLYTFLILVVLHCSPIVQVCFYMLATQENHNITHDNDEAYLNYSVLTTKL